MNRRRVAPGEVELTIVTILQFIAASALFFAPSRLLAGNGTALLTLANHPEVTDIVKTMWGIGFLIAGCVAFMALKEPREDTRRMAWQVVIPLWMCWVTGLSFPLFVGQDTNVIMLSVAFAMVAQWMVTRILVPLDSPWYSREVPLAVERQGESQVL